MNSVTLHEVQGKHVTWWWIKYQKL